MVFRLVILGGWLGIAQPLARRITTMKAETIAQFLSLNTIDCIQIPFLVYQQGKTEDL